MREYPVHSQATEPTGSISNPPDPVRRSLRLYLLVGIILFCGTMATVAVATARSSMSANMASTSGTRFSAS